MPKSILETFLTMANDDDIETIECSDNESNGPPDKPLMQLFSRLIGSDHKQNTVLTNAQIVEILQNEFNIDILDLHELEVEIYLNIMKKFLKDWPQWDDIDNIIKQKQENYKSINNIIQSKYNKLKDYLKEMLDISKPLAREAVENAKLQTEGHTNNVSIDTSDIVMEIQCTRSQLNQLIFQNPQPTLNNTIFNVAESAPSRIIVNPLSLLSIVNWFNVTVTVNLKGLVYMREPILELKHELINKKLKQENSDSNELDQDPQIKAYIKKPLYYKKTAFPNYLKKVMKLLKQLIKHQYNLNDFKEIFEMIENDLKHFPDVIRVPGNYRRYTNPYKYVRFLYKNTQNQSTSSNYDLQLKETLSPLIQYNITNFAPNIVEVPNYGNWIIIECRDCSQVFSSCNIDFLKNHFMLHQSEGDWTCTNCNKVFPMPVLAAKSWEHKCDT